MFEILLTIFFTLAWGWFWLKSHRAHEERFSREADRRSRYLSALLAGCALGSLVLIWLPKLCCLIRLDLRAI